MRRLLLLTVIPCLVGSASAQNAQGQLSLTIYNSNVALVQDVRQLDIAAGRSKLEFKDVSTGIRPETVALSGQGLSVVEQNFDYDLLTPSKMMEKAVGKQIQIVRTIPGTGAEKTETATVLSVNNGVVLKIGDHIEVLRDDGIPTRVIFDGIPENLRARPTLSVTVDAASGGPRAATLSYLTTGLSWTADYVAQFDDKEGQLALQGWITLTNHTGTSFADVSPRLVAESPGQLQRPMPVSIGALRAAGTTPNANDQDFPVYTVPGKVTVAENQTKQVSFLDISGIKAQKIYQYTATYFTSQDTPAHVSTAVTFSNAGAMPSGTVRVYMRDIDGSPKFVGEQHIDAAPGGSDLSITLGNAFDVTVKSTVTSSEPRDSNLVSRSMRYDFRNAGAVPAMVRFRQAGLGNSDNFVTQESQPGRRIDAFSEEWDVTVPAHGGSVLTFTTTG